MTIQYLHNNCRACKVFHIEIARRLKAIKYPGVASCTSYQDICEMFWRDTITQFSFLLNTPEYRGKVITWASFAQLISNYSADTERIPLIVDLLLLADSLTKSADNPPDEASGG